MLILMLALILALVLHGTFFLLFSPISCDVFRYALPAFTSAHNPLECLIF
jgi:hypothetical protein